MAYDKVVDSSVLDAGLKQIADVIREKSGTSDSLAFPTDMVEAIAAIEAGNGVGGSDGAELFNEMYCVYGSYTPAEEQTSTVYVHEFENLTSYNTSTITAIKKQSVAVVYAYMPDSDYVPTYPLVWISCFCSGKDATTNFKNSSLRSHTSINAALFGTNDLSVTIGCDSTYPLPAGQEYRWLALIPKKYIVL